MSDFSDAYPHSLKVLVAGPQGVQVPMREIVLSGGEPPLRVYDTSGPGSDAATGLPPLRRPWILDRQDVKAYEGRPVNTRDDGRAAERRAKSAEQFQGPVRKPLRARTREWLVPTRGTCSSMQAATRHAISLPWRTFP